MILQYDAPIKFGELVEGHAFILNPDDSSVMKKVAPTRSASGGLNAIGVTIFVAGHPKPQGSKKAFRRGTKIVMVESCEKLKDWRSSVSYHVAQVRPTKIIDNDVWVRLEFYLPRPKNHYGTGKNSKTVRPTAPRYPSGHMSGDIDKLTRSILDAITGVLIADDSQVVLLEATKRFVEDQPGVMIYLGEVKG